MYDGFMIPCDQVDEIDEFINQLNDFTKTENVKWTMKDHEIGLYDDILELEADDSYSTVQDDFNSMSLKLIEDIFKDKLYKCNNLVYLKTHEKWIINQEEIKRQIIKQLTTLRLYIDYKTDKPPIIINKLNQYKELVEFIYINIKTKNNLLDEIFNNTLNKIYFNNGFYCSKQNKFIKTNDFNTLIRIEKEYIDIETSESEKIIYDKILYPIFTIDKKRDDYQVRLDLLNNFLHNISRAIFGYIQDKIWYSLEGLRDCGKGVICDLLKAVFNDYIVNTNSENFLYSKSDCKDIAKMNSFLLDFQFTRLVICNEISIGKDSYIDGNKIKKLISGGDYIQARKNYQDETNFRVQSSLLMCANDMPRINPSDCKEKLKCY